MEIPQTNFRENLDKRSPLKKSSYNWSTMEPGCNDGSPDHCDVLDSPST
jgi:hypothetical protein